VYHLLTRLKLRGCYRLRYEIACKYVKYGDSVLDVCAAAGEFKNYLPNNCKYECIECSQGFISKLESKKIAYKKINLHEGINCVRIKSDILVMITSLCQFKETSAHGLLEEFKNIADKIVIVEDVLGNMWHEGGIVQRVIKHLHETEFYSQKSVYSAAEYEKILGDHGYEYIKYDNRYAVGYYNRLKQIDTEKI